MTILHPRELRDMTPAERQAELESIETELLNAQAVKAAGGMPENPARIGEMRRAIARIKTIQREEGDLDEDIDETAVEETETLTSGLFGGSDEADEPDEADDAEPAADEQDDAGAGDADGDDDEAAAAVAAENGGDDATEEEP
jgi:large subunit ribosomal protein L29